MLHAIIYVHTEYHSGIRQLPVMLLEEERIPYEVRVVKPAEIIMRSKGRVAFGWVIELHNGAGVATNWKELYRILEDHGMLSP